MKSNSKILNKSKNSEEKKIETKEEVNKKNSIVLHTKPQNPDKFPKNVNLRINYILFLISKMNNKVRAAQQLDYCDKIYDKTLEEDIYISLDNKHAQYPFLACIFCLIFSLLEIAFS